LPRLSQLQTYWPFLEWNKYDYTRELTTLPPTRRNLVHPHFERERKLCLKPLSTNLAVIARVWIHQLINVETDQDTDIHWDAKRNMFRDVGLEDCIARRAALRKWAPDR